VTHRAARAFSLLALLGVLAGAAGCGGQADSAATRIEAKSLRMPAPGPSRSNDTSLPYEFEYQMFEKIYPVDEEAGVAAATPGQRGVYALAAVDDEIQNGGFDQLFVNTAGEFFGDALAGARLFGATQHMRVLEKAARLFPNGVVPKDRGERAAASDTIRPGRLAQLDDEWFSIRPILGRYMLRYMNAHPSEFFAER
jgi:hypothetical protein